MAEVIEHVDQAQWRELARLFLDYSYRQLWDFGTACAMRVGAISEHIALTQGGNVAGIAVVRIKKIPALRTGIAYINGGPMVRKGNDTDSERLRFCLQVLADEYVRKRGFVLRVLAPLGPPSWNDIQTSIFTDMGFALSTHVPRYRTFLLDINRPLDEIHKTLSQEWCRNLKRAKKRQPQIRGGTGKDLFSQFCELHEQLIRRKQFDVDLDAAFYAQLQERLANSERFHISIADIEEKPAAGYVVSMLGDTCVPLLSASNESGLRSRVSYLLQWHTIQIAHEHGCRWYDLGGIDPQGNPGVYHFKQGLGGIDIAAPGPFELSPSKMKAYLVAGGEYLYHTVRRMFRPQQ